MARRELAGERPTTLSRSFQNNPQNRPYSAWASENIFGIMTMFSFCQHCFHTHAHLSFLIGL